MLRTSEPATLRRGPAVHLWLPEVAKSTGGIQIFLQFFLEAYGASTLAEKTVVFIKNDVDAVPPAPACAVRPMVFRCFGSHRAGWRRNLAFAFAVLYHACRERPRLIIVGHAYFASLAALVQRTLGIRFWAIAYGIEVIDQARAGATANLRRAAKLLSISRYTRDHLIQQWKVSPDRCCLLPTTVDGRRFQPGPKPAWLLGKLGLRPEQRVILTVCRLESAEAYKGYDQIIEALPEIIKTVPDVHYVLAGKGDDRARLVRCIERLDLGSHVTLAGFVPDEKLADYYRLCDVFAMPSRKEGFGIVFLEALACGKPVMGGNRDGAVDALCGGELGVLVDPDDTAQIAAQLAEMLRGSHSHPLLRQPEELRRRVLATYGRQRFKEILAGLLREPPWLDVPPKAS